MEEDEEDEDEEEEEESDDDDDEEEEEEVKKEEEEKEEEKVVIELRKNPQPLEGLKSLKDRDIVKMFLPLFSWEDKRKSLIALIASNLVFFGTVLCGFNLFGLVCFLSFFAILASGLFIYAPILYKKYAEGVQPSEDSKPGDALAEYSKWLVVPVDIISEIAEFTGEAVVAFLEALDAAVFFRTSLIFSGQFAFCLVLVSILMSRFGFVVLLWVATDACFAGFPFYKENKKLVDEYAKEIYAEVLLLVDNGKEWIKSH